MNLRLRTVRVFEHDRLVVGHSYSDTRGKPVVFTESHFLAMVRFNDQNGGRFFSARNRAIHFTQHVGVVQVGHVSIEILPKADRGRTTSSDYPKWHDALIKMLVVTRRLRIHRSSPSFLGVRRAKLFDLYVDMFLRYVEELVHQGLARRYRSERGSNAAFRGRLLVAENMRENIAHAERFFVEFQTFDESHIVNQILQAALRVLTKFAGGTFDSRIRPLLGAFESVAARRIEPAVFRDVVLSRTTDRYAPALGLARLILLHYCPDVRAGREPLLAFLFDMNLLFEEFVGRMVATARIPGVSVNLQESRPFWPAEGFPKRRIRADIVVRQASTSSTVILDTKWKSPGPADPEDDDLRQMFVYNHYFGARHAILLYPVGLRESTPRRRGWFLGERHGCSLAHVDLFDSGRFSLRHIRDQLRNLVEGAVTVQAPESGSAPA